MGAVAAHEVSRPARLRQDANRTYRRTGSLWEGRFRSSLVQSERYLLACYRYIEMNPVRAAMVMHPSDYPWSSYAANAEGKPVSCITPHGEYLALGRNEESRRAAYRGLFASELEPPLLSEIRVSTHGGYALGSSRFREEIETALLRRRGRARRVGRGIRTRADVRLRRIDLWVSIGLKNLP